MIHYPSGNRIIMAPTAQAAAAALVPEVTVETAVEVAAKVIRAERSVGLTKADVAFLASLILALDTDAPSWLRMTLAMALCIAYCSRES